MDNLGTSYKFIKIFLSFIIFLLSMDSNAISIFDTGKVYTFSGISGIIQKDGIPIKNATVVRKVYYQKNKIDKTKTNEVGYFEMPALFERSLLSLLPQEFVVNQFIAITTNGEEHIIWDGVKRIKNENSESRGKPLFVICDIEKEYQVIEVDGQRFITKCKWDVIPDSANKEV
ncbi:carboxypeptidase regulatory-like domain-containing protein [Microbulbifer thermotolerans]|uniref:DUF6795 domain-containing protein n=1 Tax=Microbulbifer thermotolerans TaxID=252514 RepID=UPI00224AE1E2|nr:DUF6795 domain-containing protein [Microbulbifer thermotolerans]MCX2840445.1 carboxypeptidase regulatory-like domain-containing protein [Microbulbifer thermotolerans]